MMLIFGPLVAPRISAVTSYLATSAGALTTLSPSTTSTAGSVTVEPISPASLSTFSTSSTATFSCLPPQRTIAYTGGTFPLRASDTTETNKAHFGSCCLHPSDEGLRRANNDARAPESLGYRIRRPEVEPDGVGAAIAGPLPRRARQSAAASDLARGDRRVRLRRPFAGGSPSP